MTQDTRHPSAAARIAAFARDFDASRLSPSQRHLCGRSLADTYGVGVAGRNEHAPQAALDYLSKAGLLLPADSPAPSASSASLWGRSERAAPEIAAWWNGIAGHVLDYDDVTVPMVGHPSVALWPALLALAESRDLPGARVASAFVVGLEVICKLSHGMARNHYAKGWHSTASIGALGATVACAHLLALSETQLTHALGLAVAQVAGSRENVGTEGKSFQAGHAGAVAVRAASLAESGFEAGPGAIDGPFGYLRLYADGADVAPWLETLGQSPLELEASGLDVKQYPMCYATHCALDAILDLQATHKLGLQDVASVEVSTSRGALIPLIHPHARSGLEGKFSMPYAMAAALADGAVRLRSFTDLAVARPELQAFMAKVDARETDQPASRPWAEVTLHLRDGSLLKNKVETLRGSARKPLSDAELAAKLEDCLQWGGSRAGGDALLQQCLALPTLNGRAAVAALQSLALAN